MRLNRENENTLGFVHCLLHSDLLHSDLLLRDKGDDRETTGREKEILICFCLHGLRGHHANTVSEATFRHGAYARNVRSRVDGASVLGHERELQQ